MSRFKVAGTSLLLASSLMFANVARAWDVQTDTRISVVETDVERDSINIYTRARICRGSTTGKDGATDKQGILPAANNEAARSRVLAVALAAYTSGRRVRIFTSNVNGVCRVELIRLL